MGYARGHRFVLGHAPPNVAQADRAGGDPRLPAAREPATAHRPGRGRRVVDRAPGRPPGGRREGGRMTGDEWPTPEYDYEPSVPPRNADWDWIWILVAIAVLATIVLFLVLWVS